MKEEDIKHILVIRFRRVGDAVLSTVICSSLRKTFPNAKIDYVVNEGIDSLFRGHPDIDKLITFDAKDNHSLFRFLVKVWRITRATPYDIIVDTRSTTRTLSFSLLSLRSKFRIGVAKKYNLGIQNYPVKVRALKNVNIVQWLLHLLEPLGAQFNLQQIKKFRLYPQQSALESTRQSMLKAGINFEKPIVFVAATTRIQNKMWSTTKMAQTLQQLIDTYGCQLVFNAMGIEKKILAEIKQLTARDSFWFDEVEAPSLGDLSALIKNCHFFFGNEGGPRHIAHALDVPSLAIFPPGTSAAKWLPDPDDSQQAISASPSAAGSDWLSVDEVWDRLVSFLDLHLPQKALSNN